MAQPYFQAEPIADQLHQVGENLEMEAVLNSRGIDHQDLKVELVYSAAQDELKHHLYTVPIGAKTYDDGAVRYQASFKAKISGRLCYGIRVYPSHENLTSPFDSGLIRWA
ncbi:MAG: hypothetical protein R2865_03735 [Deinococcales bacterium]